MVQFSRAPQQGPEAPLWELGLLAAPGLALAAAGLTHPHRLDPESARWWFLLHLMGLFVFPLVGAALAWLVRGRTDPVAWLVRLGSFVYACAYTALDTISGLTAGYVTDQLGDVPRPDEVRLLFRIGTPLGEVGSAALIAVALLLSVEAVRRWGGVGLGLLVLPLGGYLVHIDHIFAPTGVMGMALIGVGTAGYAYLAAREGGRDGTDELAGDPKPATPARNL